MFIYLSSEIPSGRVRSILIDASVAGYPVQIAFECKNEREITGTPKINLFLGKPEDVGIPPQQAIFVSIKGFTKGALACRS